MKLNILYQPYPFVSSPRKQAALAPFFGLFVFLFIWIFQPFGLQDYQDQNRVLHFAGYGVITSTVMVFVSLLFRALLPNWFQEKTWTVGKSLSYVLFIFFMIGIANWVYSTNLGLWGISLRSFFIYQGMTMLIGVFPVTISTFVIYQKRLQEALNNAQALNANMPSKNHELRNQPNQIQIPSQNKSEDLTVDPNELLYIMAVENYIEVQLPNEKFILRNTLKAAESVLADFPQFKRCHRSYIVNLDKIDSFSGNAQGLNLRLQAENLYEIPVSRTYVPEIKAAL